MSSEKYIGLDVHQATISVAAMAIFRELLRISRTGCDPASELQFFRPCEV